jgi:glutaminyl-tRNA synthetase
MARNIALMRNTESNLKKHLDFTQGKVFTRFPPEPNGFLHIGHAKSMRFNFNNAKLAHGHCYLRFDDTNPDKETDEFIENIKENVKWLGYTPYKITHASEYFEELYNLAVELIKRGKAYVCHQKKEEVAEGRDKMIDSPYRNRSVEETSNSKLFEMMRQGRFDAGEVRILLTLYCSVL